MAWRVADDEAVVLHADTSAYFGLNRTGTILWRQLAERSWSIDQLVAWVRQHIDKVPDSAAAEIAAFVDDLASNRLIVAVALPDAGAVATSPDLADVRSVAWAAPVAELFGELEKLILSGE